MSDNTYWNKETNKYLPIHTRLIRVGDEIKKKLPNGGRVLDLGCSRMTLKNIIGEKFDYYGIDIVDNQDYEKYAKFDLAKDNFQSFPFLFKFDVIVCSGIFEYLELERIKEILNFVSEKISHDNTIFIFTYTNFNHISRLFVPNHEKWITIMSIKDMKSVFIDSGFYVLDYFPSYYKIGPGPLSSGWNENLQKKIKINIPLFSNIFGKQFVFVLRKNKKMKL